MMTSLASLKALTLAMVLMGTGSLLNSQEPDAVVVDEATAVTILVPGDDLGGTPGQRLAKLHAINAQIIKRQAATLEKLEKLEREAEQLRIFTKRS